MGGVAHGRGFSHDELQLAIISLKQTVDLSSSVGWVAHGIGSSLDELDFAIISLKQIVDLSSSAYCAFAAGGEILSLGIKSGRDGRGSITIGRSAVVGVSGNSTSILIGDGIRLGRG